MFWNKKKRKSKSTVKQVTPKTLDVKKPPKWQPTFGVDPASKINWEDKFVKTFQKFTSRHRAWDVWRDYILCHALAISNALDKRYYDQREDRYLKIINRYSKEEQLIFSELAAYTTMALEQNPEQDFLGKMFMKLELSNRSTGQFFTPYDVCSLMAEVTVADVPKKIKEQGYVSINDPCCGAGATLIAGAHAVRKQLEKCDPPLNFQNHVLIVGQDIDEIVGLMCYIQISLLGLAGFVKIGNSITNPISTDDSPEKYWYTPIYFSDVWSTRRAIAQLNKLFGKEDGK